MLAKQIDPDADWPTICHNRSWKPQTNSETRSNFHQPNQFRQSALERKTIYLAVKFRLSTMNKNMEKINDEIVIRMHWLDANNTTRNRTDKTDWPFGLSDK